MQVENRRDSEYQLVQLCKLSQAKKVHIPKDWNVLQLKDVAIISPEIIDNNYRQRDIYYIDIGSIEDYKIQKYERLDLNKRPSRAQRIVRLNDIIVSTVRPYLKGFAKIDISKTNLVCSTGFTVLRPKNHVETDFIFNHIKSYNFEVDMNRHMEGMAYPAVTSKMIANSIIPYPANQRETDKIGIILSKVDELLQKVNQVIELTQELRKGLMQKLLSKGIGHLKFKKILYNPYSSIILGFIPESWDISTVHELKKNRSITEFQDGNHGELHPKPSDFSYSGRPFITAAQIDRYGKVDLIKCNKLPEDYIKKLRIGFSKGNDVLFTHNATVGRVAILPNDVGDCIVGTSVTYYRLNDNKLDRTFFAYVLRSSFIRRQYEREMDQTTRQQFSIQKQAKLKIPIAGIGEQRKIGSVLNNIDTLATKQLGRKYYLESLKKGLLQKLLTGKIRVKV